MLSIMTTLEFLQHHFAKLGHRNYAYDAQNSFPHFPFFVFVPAVARALWRNKASIHVHYGRTAQENSLPPFEASSIQNEWPVLLECASSQPDARKLSALVQMANEPRLLELATEHGVLGHQLFLTHTREISF